MTQKTKTISFESDPDAIKRVDEIASEMGTSRSWFIRRAIRKELEIVAISSLPHPVDANPVPVVYVADGR